MLKRNLKRQKNETKIKKKVKKQKKQQNKQERIKILLNKNKVILNNFIRILFLFTYFGTVDYAEYTSSFLHRLSFFFPPCKPDFEYTDCILDRVLRFPTPPICKEKRDVLSTMPLFKGPHLPRIFWLHLCREDNHHQVVS